MIKEGMTIREATQKWVNSFNAIPRGMIAALMEYDEDDWFEATTPSVDSRVYVYASEYTDKYGNDGYIRSYDAETDLYCIELDNEKLLSLSEEDFKLDYDCLLPMWNTMWSFSNSCDTYWLEEEGGIKKMSECGFRVYESEKFGYFFGIDGAGYDFLEAHWIPLYKARGLQWHDEGQDKD